MKKKLLLFVIITFVSGIFIFFGSIIGNSQNSDGLFVGAIIGGFIGVGLGAWISRKVLLIERSKLGAIMIGGCIGFIIAAIIAVKTLSGPIIPILSTSLIGIGAIVGYNFKK